MARHATNARDAILDAAEDVVVELGARHLTLNEVAARAGKSRGGVLYHFADKEALLRGMLERRIAHISSMREKRRANLPDTPESEVTAFVLANLEGSKRQKRIASSVIAAAGHDPGLLCPARREYREFINRLVSGGLRAERAAVIVLAVEGLILSELLSLFHFDKAKRSGIIKEIISLTRDGTRE
jgi:AcrR family transcriptional regulator